MHELAHWFESVETGQSFETCKICEKSLFLSTNAWVVNKHYHRQECILEYAVCEPCRDQVTKEFSGSSKAAIRDFLESNIDWEQRMLDWMELEQPAGRMDQCVACLCPRETMHGFTISAQFSHDGSLIDGPLPLLLCSQCVSQITDNLSPQSLAAWNQFIATYFEGPDAGSPNFWTI